LFLNMNTYILQKWNKILVWMVSSAISDPT